MRREDSRRVLETTICLVANNLIVEKSYAHFRAIRVSNLSFSCLRVEKKSLLTSSFMKFYFELFINVRVF